MSTNKEEIISHKVRVQLIICVQCSRPQNLLPSSQNRMHALYQLLCSLVLAFPICVKVFMYAYNLLTG